jgi:chromosome segregation ATPase
MTASDIEKMGLLNRLQDTIGEKGAETLMNIISSGPADDIAELKADVGVLKTDVAELKTDVAVLKTDVAELKTDVAVLKTDVALLRTDVKNLQENMREMRSDVRDIRGDITGLRSDMTRVEVTVYKAINRHLTFSVMAIFSANTITVAAMKLLG